MPNTIELRLQPSLRLFFLSFAIAALLAVAIGIAAVGFKFKLVVLIGLVLYSWQILKQHAFLQSQRSALRISYDAQQPDRLTVISRDHSKIEYELHSSSFIHPQISIIALKHPAKGWRFFDWLPRCVVLTADNCEQLPFRRLRVALQHRPQS